MNIKILNQYTQVWEVDGHETVDVYRTHKTLEQLKDNLNIKGAVTDGEWADDGQITAVWSILQDALGNVARAHDFNKKPFGEKGYHTLDEIKQSDLVWVEGYGIVDDIELFESKFKVAAQKK